ncbi:hypothetical protein [Polaribacter porphyrae]|uniref:Lipoprotein n=1 Tax=Polaribacter porphyrae TaxID=1137780 RepID=A0A2S7WSM4_9FLAO|nr:hypothetical protein [Polaribacter porphyrae]PQJ80598.1 hypothetical protein BTO18_16065 [Polaribacter porphyrae]
MKKIISILSFTLIIFCSCSTPSSEEDTTDPDDIISAEDRVVKMEFNTTEINSDEIRISYFDYLTNTYPVVVHQFSYDSSGQPIPFVITLENYNYRYINGEAYRNNPNPKEISVKVFVNDELAVEDIGKGEGGEYAEIRFNYDIDLMKSI